MNVPEAPEWAPVSDELGRLADAYGVATEYWDQAGNLVRVGAATVEAVLRALGQDVSSSAGIQAALEAIRLRDWRRMLPPVYVIRQGEDRRLWVHVPHGHPVHVWVDAEDGARIDLDQMDWWVAPVEVDGSLVGEASFRVPGDLPLGWHTIHARSDVQEATTPLVVAPDRLDPAAIAGDRQWGFMTQVYAMRSSSSWGMGDLHDLSALSSWSGSELGAGFVLINPLHAASPVPPMSPSPYLPVTRRFANPMYLHVEDVPEFAALNPVVAARLEQLAEQLRHLNRTADLLDRDVVWGAKRVALEAVHQVGLSDDRRAEFDAYCAAEGTGLLDFATWCAMSDVHGALPDEWPAELSHPANPEVAAFRAEHAGLVDFHLWAQWLVDQQMGATQRAARESGMPIGIMHDLAVGVHPEGSDAWALQDVLARGVSVGAPPDMYNQMGQDWSQPPWRPDALAEAAFGPYRDMLRTVLSHAGGLRIDHVLGLFRLWWVPQGFPAYAGTFVRFDYDAMLSILMLEAHRAGALVVGEDLGTVEPWVQVALAERGILGTSILWFETVDGGLKDPDDWRRDVLASVTVHDLPPDRRLPARRARAHPQRAGPADDVRPGRARQRRRGASRMGRGASPARLAGRGPGPRQRRGSRGAGRRPAPRGGRVPGATRRRLAARRRRRPARPEPARHRSGVPQLAGPDDGRVRPAGPARGPDGGAAAARPHHGRCPLGLGREPT